MIILILQVYALNTVKHFIHTLTSHSFCSQNYFSNKNILKTTSNLDGCKTNINLKQLIIGINFLQSNIFKLYDIKNFFFFIISTERYKTD